MNESVMDLMATTRCNGSVLDREFTNRRTEESLLSESAKDFQPVSLAESDSIITRLILKSLLRLSNLKRSLKNQRIILTSVFAVKMLMLERVWFLLLPADPLINPDSRTTTSSFPSTIKSSLHIQNSSWKHTKSWRAKPSKWLSLAIEN